MIVVGVDDEPAALAVGLGAENLGAALVEDLLQRDAQGAQVRLDVPVAMTK
jgi:hypothetical protein